MSQDDLHSIDYLRTETPRIIQLSGLERYSLEKTITFILDVISYFDHTGAYHVDEVKQQEIETRPVYCKQEVSELKAFLNKVSNWRPKQ